MSHGLEIDLKEIVLSNSSFGPHEIEQLIRAISEDSAKLAVLRDSVGELEMSENLTPAMAVRLGVCYYLLGRIPRAIDTLRNADGSALALFYLGERSMPAANMARRSPATMRRKGPVTTAINVRWPAARHSVIWATRPGRWPR